jgi:hypothetical protein
MFRMHFISITMSLALSKFGVYRQIRGGHAMKKTVREKLMAMLITLAMIISLIPALTIGAAAAITEQFTLSPGGTYYFDLSSKFGDILYDKDIPSVTNKVTINTALPDASLKWLSFTYVGTVDAYSRTTAGVSTDQSVTVSPRSLFVSDYAVSKNVSWDGLNGKSLIFGTSYTANGISYNLRSLSMGSTGNGQSGGAARGTPSSNEWDQVLNKNSSYIKFQNEIFCWGQDSLSSDGSWRVGRSWHDIQYFGNNPSSYRDAYDGFRPALEILNAGTLGADGLKTVTYDMGGNGKIGSAAGSLTQASVVYTGELTLPAVTEANGFYYTGTVQAGKTLGWLDSSGKFYAAGTKLSDLTTGITLTTGYDVTVPTVTTISPTQGPLAGGTNVTITGTNFTWASAVHFGTTVSSFTVNSATQITAIAPAGSAGPVDITVKTAGGTSETESADQYSYVAAPTATTGSATSVTSTEATLDGIVNANNASTTVTFEYGTTTGYGTVVSAEQSPVTGNNISSKPVSCVISGLTPSTTYHFIIKAVNLAGTTYSSDMTFTTSAVLSGNDAGGQSSTSTSTFIEINGKVQDAGTSSTSTTSSGQSVTTFTVNDAKLDKFLESSGTAPKVTLPSSTGSTGVVGVLTGQTVKNMAKKEAVLEIKTDYVTYTLPASQINIDSVSSQMGNQVELKNIAVKVRIAEPSADTVRVVENTASKGNYQLVVRPVEFEITCTSGGKMVEISKFNGYVERTVAIPDGIDPSKITTGIVLNSDGTFSHVPTQITLINGKYYAKISSLTNSTYSVIWNPVTFTDVANHWAKNAVNDMGSRMVVTGMGNGTYEPDRSITRAEFAAIVVRALGLRQGTTESAFGDVSASDWFNGYVDTATAYSLITGYDSASYGPNDTITREQAMAILARAMKLTGLRVVLTDSESSALLEKYADGASVSEYAKESAEICLKTGVVTGSSATTLSPKAYVTRAEVAVMAQRLLQKSGLI